MFYKLYITPSYALEQLEIILSFHCLVNGNLHICTPHDVAESSINFRQSGTNIFSVYIYKRHAKH